MKVIKTTEAPAAIGPYVQGKVVQGILYSSGQLGMNPVTGELVSPLIEKQTGQVMENIKALLAAGDSSFEKIIKTTCFLSDMENFGIFNEVYSSYFEGEFPARSCVEVARLPKDALVEIEFIAETNS
ncbi:RidA family protein [Vagococcus salmoninarum]|uniref:RidA family protein n=1 Tax=Vagococcus salmoninarum TaxID=2739 RepID=UPI0018825463|nr:RidA family protein [Vagococcus salmoninarum]MBE9388878.1 RidA family protein [Vagococcus salmoninarum]